MTRLSSQSDKTMTSEYDRYSGERRQDGLSFVSPQPEDLIKNAQIKERPRLDGRVI